MELGPGIPRKCHCGSFDNTPHFENSRQPRSQVLPVRCCFWGQSLVQMGR
ncbi:unnamed protein product [Brassica rapa]|uniref:Uncharacterized protein n=1 Tax=Brassica campestris TaxID=3711 RepID=A0A8D9GRT8_BRACM|nr:unnamed protein product [Brassica rapa]